MGGTRKTIRDFWWQIRQTDECWLWLGRQNIDGYGCFCIDGVEWRVHRFSWFLHHGNIPKGRRDFTKTTKLVLHKCHNRLCVNPDHLYLGTQKNNVQDQLKAGTHTSARRTHCKRGHKLTEENISSAPSTKKRNWRRCKLCRRKATGIYYYEPVRRNH